MRTISTGQEAILTADSRSVHVRVKINRGSSDWVDLTDLDGRSWLIGCTVSESVDKRVSTATVSLMREVYKLSLAPFDDDSKINAVGTIADLNNPIVIETATTAQDSQPDESDYVEIFRGRIDSVNWATHTIKLICSDQSGVLVSTFIEEVVPQGLPSTTPTTGGLIISTCLQDIIDTSINTVTGIPPYSAASPLTIYSVNGTGGTPFNAGDMVGFYIVKYSQQKMTVMAALQALVSAIGYDIRWVYHNNTSQYQLVFLNIDRTQTAANREFNSSQYFDLTELKIETKDVRNVVRVIYGPAPEETEAGVNEREDEEVEDAASIAKYGRRYMQLGEASSSQIDTDSEALSFANAAIADLAEPLAHMGAAMPYFWPVMVNDLYEFKADGDPRFSTDQKLAVTSFTHRFTATEAKTEMKLRGKPSGGTKRWVNIESRPGKALSHPAEDDSTPPTATGVVINPTIGGLAISWVDPKKIEPSPWSWSGSEVHVSTSPGFTPSSLTLKETARVNMIPVTDLTPGVAQYVKVLHKSRFGKVSDPGSAVEVGSTTQTVGPYHMNPDWRWPLAIANGNFNIATLSAVTTPPDDWAVTSSAWADDLQLDPSISRSGPQSILSRDNGNVSARIIQSEYFPIEAGKIYASRVVFMIDATNAGTIRTTVYWYDKDKSFISPAVLMINQSMSALATDTWIEKYEGGVKAPSTARFAKISVSHSPTTATNQANIDSCTFNACTIGLNVGLSSAQSIVKNTVTEIELDDSSRPGQFNYASLWDTSNFYFQAPHSGIYLFSITGNLQGVTSGKLWSAELENDTANDFSSASSLSTIHSVTSDGTDAYLTGTFGAFELDAGTYCRVNAHFVNGSDPSDLDVKFSITEISNGFI